MPSSSPRLWKSFFGGAQTQAELTRFDISAYLEIWENNWGGLRTPLYPPAVSYSMGQPTERVENSFRGYTYGGYKMSPVVYGCMSRRSTVFAEARFMYRRLRNGVPGELFWDDSLNLLQTPWPNGTTAQLLTRMIQDVDLAGNAYIVNEGGRLRRLRPDWTQIILSGNPLTDHDIDILGYVFTPGSPDSGIDPQVYMVDEMCHFAPLPDPMATYRGMSWMTPVVREIEADEASVTHKLNFFRNGATLGPVITYPPQITYDQFLKFKEAADAKHVGVENAYRPMYLGGGADVKVTRDSFQQLDFSSLQGHSETRVCVAAGVPAAIVGVSEGLQGSSLNAGTYGPARRSFIDGTIRNLWSNACAALGTILPVPPDAELWYDESRIAYLHEDQQDVAQIQQTQATAINVLITAGFEPKSVVEAVTKDDLTLLEHTGLTSVQLSPPGSPGEPSADQVASEEGNDSDSEDEDDEDSGQSGDGEGEDNSDDEDDGEDGARSALLLDLLEEQIWRAGFDDDAWDEEIARGAEHDVSKELRVAKGSRGGGEWRSLASRVDDALAAWGRGEEVKGEDPLADFSPRQLRSVAEARGLVNQGERVPPVVLKERILADQRSRIIKARQGARTSHRVTMTHPTTGKLVDVSVSGWPKTGQMYVHQESDTGRRGARVSPNFDSLADLEAWARANGHSELAAYAAMHSPESIRPAPAAPARKAAKSAAKATQPDVAALAAKLNSGGRLNDANPTERRLHDAIKSLTHPNYRDEGKAKVRAEFAGDLNADTSGALVARTIAAAEPTAPALYRGRYNVRPESLPEVGDVISVHPSSFDEKSRIGDSYAGRQAMHMEEGTHAVIYKVAPGSRAINVANNSYEEPGASSGHDEWLTGGKFRIRSQSQRTVDGPLGIKVPVTEYELEQVHDEGRAPSVAGVPGEHADVHAALADLKMPQLREVAREHNVKLTGVRKAEDMRGEIVNQTLGSGLRRVGDERSMAALRERQHADLMATIGRIRGEGGTAKTVNREGELAMHERIGPLVSHGKPDWLDPAKVQAAMHEETLASLRAAGSRNEAAALLAKHQKGDLQALATHAGVPFKASATKATLTGAILDEAGHGEAEHVAAAGSGGQLDEHAQKARTIAQDATLSKRERVNQLRQRANEIGHTAFVAAGGDLNPREAIKSPAYLDAQAHAQLYRDEAYNLEAGTSGERHDPTASISQLRTLPTADAMAEHIKGLTGPQLRQLADDMNLSHVRALPSKATVGQWRNAIAEEVAGDRLRRFGRDSGITNSLITRLPANSAAIPHVEVSPHSALTTADVMHGETLTPAGRSALASLGPAGHPDVAAIPDTEGKIREAHRILTTPGHEDSAVSLHNVRAMLGEQATKEQVDETLRQMAHKSDVYLSPQEAGRGSTAQKAAAVTIGGQEMNLMQIGAAATPATPIGEVKDRIRAAYAARPKSAGGWVGLADLRDDLSDLRREDVDEGLRQLSREKGVRLDPFDNVRSLDQRDRNAALPHGDADRHMIAIGSASDGHRSDPVDHVEAAEQAARDQQAQLDQARHAATILAEADELGHAGASARAFKARMQSRTGTLPTRTADRLTAAYGAGDRERLNGMIAEHEQKYGLTRTTGRAGSTVAYDPAQHQMLGGNRPEHAGKLVTVVRPGYATHVTGERVLVHKAVVDAPEDEAHRAVELDDDEILRLAGHDIEPGHNYFEHYWTKDPEGLAKWVDSPRPWTTLLAHLSKFMEPEEAKKTASLWFEKTMGYSAGSDENRVAHGEPPRGKRVGPG